jgi:hypothetical protein
VTLVWHDMPAFPGTKFVLVNNLDLLVTGPGAGAPEPSGPARQQPGGVGIAIGGGATGKQARANHWWGNNVTGGDYHNNVEKVGRIALCKSCCSDMS